MTPDLACFSKSIANGYPLSAIVGPEEYLRHLPDVFFTMTFGGESISLAAVKACLQFIVDKDVPARLRRSGEPLRTAFDKAAKEFDLSAKASGFAARLTFLFSDSGQVTEHEQRAVFIQELLSLFSTPKEQSDSTQIGYPNRLNITLTVG